MRVLLNMLSTLIAFLIVPLGFASATAHDRTYFYVGGDYEINSRGEHIFTNQTYVEKLTPAGGALKEHPIVFVHGDGQTGTVCAVLFQIEKWSNMNRIG